MLHLLCTTIYMSILKVRCLDRLGSHKAIYCRVKFNIRGPIDFLDFFIIAPRALKFET